MPVKIDPSDDIELPNVWVEDAGDVLTVSQLVRECVDTHDDRSQRNLARSIYNERMILGEQFLDIDSAWNVVDTEDWPEQVPKTSRNLLRNLSLTWSSRILEDAPWVFCWPAEPGIDQAKAEVANKVLEYVKQTHDFEDMDFRAAEWVQAHSCVGYKAVWDPLRGPPSPGVPVYDEATGLPMYSPSGEPVLEGQGEPLGDVALQVVSVFDYGTDGSEHIEDATWCFFRRMADRFEAKALFEAAGLNPEDAEPQTYTDNWGERREGCEIIEIWFRPGPRFPKGLYAVQVGNQPISAQAFPYEHQELPLAVWKCGARRNSPFGSTHVDDATIIQRAINKNVAALDVQSQQIASQKLIAPSSVIEAWENGNQMLPVDDPQLAQAVRYLEPPPRSIVLVQSLEDNQQALYTVYGLNELLSGAENVKSGTSAKSIAYLNKLDSMKMAGASRSHNKAIIRLARQVLKLYQQYVKAPRLAQIAGDQGLAASQQFIGADMYGIDVKLESGSSRSQMRAETAQGAQDQVTAGNMDPSMAETARTGVKDTAFARASRDIVRAQAQAALQGQPEKADQEADPQIAVEELSGIANANRGNPGLPNLMALMQEYRQKLQPAQSAMQPAAGEGPVLQ